MGRRSKLTEKQWHEIERRHLNGESIRSLAKEFKVAESTIRERISAQSKRIIDVSNQIVATNQAVNSLPISAQIAAHTRAQQLLAIQGALDDASLAGSMTAKRISEAVQNRVKSRTDDELLDAEDMKALMAAGMVINTHAKLGIDIIAIDSKSTKAPPEVDNNALLREISARLPN